MQSLKWRGGAAARRPILAALAAGFIAVRASPRVHACSCLSDPDPAKQRARQLAASDLVFKGVPVRSASRDPPAWLCDFESMPKNRPRATCLVVRVTSGLCEPIKGVSVQIVPGAGDGMRKRGYTDDRGEVTTCDLRSGPYDVEARTIRGKPTRNRADFDETKGASLAIGIVHPEESRVYTTEFRVESVTKGPQVKTAIIETSEASGDCGFGNFSPNTRYEIFAKRKEGGRYAVDLCSGTTASPPRKP